MSRIIDAMLQEGILHLSHGLKDRTANYVVSKRMADGGYPGRFGKSDPYYTDFALRTLSLTRPEEIRNPATIAYAKRDDAITDIPECLNRLSIAKICDAPLPRSAGNCLYRHRLASGCYCRSVIPDVPSAYCTFLGTICEDILEVDHRNSWMDSADAILKLQIADGGFTDTGSDAKSQTNPTSAAVGYLVQASLFEPDLMNARGADFEAVMDRAGDYLLDMQAKDGGFLAHAQAPYPDLLSTFTALATLTAIDRVRQINLKKHVQFTGALADANGGFHSCIADAGSDIEYTYYGLGCLALIAFYSFCTA
jgi:geranylgeranyl transferase type-2 subunit beta